MFLFVEATGDVGHLRSFAKRNKGTVAKDDTSVAKRLLLLGGEGTVSLLEFFYHGTGDSKGDAPESFLPSL